MTLEFTTPPQFGSNDLASPITKEEIEEICNFFSNSFTASSYEPGKIDIVIHIIEKVLNISDLTPGHIAPTHMVRDKYRIDFYEFTDIFFVAYYYCLIKNHEQLADDSERRPFLLKPPFVMDDDYEANLFCVLTRGFFLNYYTYDSIANTINDHNTELSYTDFFHNMWLVSQLSTATVLNISEEIDNEYSFPSKYLNNAHDIENILKNSDFYQNVQKMNKLFEIGINPFTLPFVLFKFPHEVDDLTKLLFIGWHYGHPTYSDQLRILDQVLNLPRQCTRILANLYEIIKSGRYNFQI